jgi:uncharacterized membrane protein YeiB
VVDSGRKLEFSARMLSASAQSGRECCAVFSMLFGVGVLLFTANLSVNPRDKRDVFLIHYERKVTCDLKER